MAIVVYYILEVFIVKWMRGPLRLGRPNVICFASFHGKRDIRRLSCIAKEDIKIRKEGRAANGREIEQSQFEIECFVNVT